MQSKEIQMITIRDITIREEDELYVPFLFNTDRGTIETRYYPSHKKHTGIVFLGGEKSWDSPAKGLYGLLAEELQYQRIPSIRVNYRNPQEVTECVIDGVVAATFLLENGCKDVIIIGHDLGALVATHIATLIPDVKMIAALCPPPEFTSVLSDVPFHTSMRFVFGKNDLTPQADVRSFVHTNNVPSKIVRVYEKANHNLDEVAFDLFDTLKHWIFDEGKKRVH